LAPGSRRFPARSGALHHLEHAVEVAVRSPRRQRDAAALAADTGELTRRGFRTAGEHDPTRGHDRVELSVFKREALRIADLVSDRQPFLFGDCPCDGQELAGDVDASYRGASASHDPGRPRRKVEDPLARPGVQTEDAVLN
jgi:hypothetical protein